MGIKITLSSVRFLAKPVMEHQFNVINDFAEEIAFRNFLQDNQRALIDSFAIQLEVNGAYNWFSAAVHAARWCSARSWLSGLSCVRVEWSGTDLCPRPGRRDRYHRTRPAQRQTLCLLSAGSRFRRNGSPSQQFLLSVSRPLKVRPPITAEIRRI